MKFLVDANVLSEPTKREPNPNVVQWLRDNAAEFAVDPIILGELEYGILIQKEGTKKRRLQDWFSKVADGLSVLEFDSQAASSWAALLAKLKRAGTPMPVKDSLIAATALRHSLVLCTRNVSDFEATGLEIINPFA